MTISLDRFQKDYDIAVIGAGPAGISAALSAAVRKKRVVLMDREPMKKIKSAAVINNYPGLPGVTGQELKSAFLDHLNKFDIEINTASASKITKVKNRFSVYTGKHSFKTKSVILCPGTVEGKRIEGEEGLVGRGVSYCVTCDGLLYQGKNVAVISDFEGGEDEARALAEDYNCKVTYIPLDTKNDKSPGHETPDMFGINLINEPPIMLSEGTEGQINISFEKRTITVDGIFISRAVAPPASLLRGLEMNKNYITVGPSMETSIRGVFAAGDCTGPPFQIAKAAGQGQLAALSAVEYLGKKRSPK